MSCELSVIVPAYQEGKHIRQSLQSIIQHVEVLTSGYEVIVVDDGSTDGTWQEICNLRAEHPRVLGIRLSRNFGKELALAAGLDASTGQAALILDADLQHPPRLIAALYAPWKSGQADVVEGVKRLRTGEPLSRRVTSRLFNRMAAWLTGIDFAGSSDFKLLDRKVISAWTSLPEKRPFFRGMIDWVGFRHVQVYFDVDVRQAGQSRWRTGALIKLAWTAITSYSAGPLRLIFGIAFAFMAFAITLAARALYMYARGVAVTGFTTVIIILLVVGGSVLCCLGIIAEYIAAIYEEIKNRPRYVIADRTS